MENCEIERKFIIRRPEDSRLIGQAGCHRKEIIQTYLTAEPGWERRVRRSAEGESIRYTETCKSAEAGLCRTELEREITREEYERLLAEKEPEHVPLQKVRYAFPYEGHTIEIDCYPFWPEKAVLEVELFSPKEAFSLPPEITVLREATDDPELKNHALAMAAAHEKERVAEGKNGERAESCPCRRHRCPRFGNCTECRAHHAQNKHPVACERTARRLRVKR